MKKKKKMKKKEVQIVRRPISCPYPIKGDNGTATDCNNKGHCTCELSSLMPPPPRKVSKEEIRAGIAENNKEIKRLTRGRDELKKWLKELHLYPVVKKHVHLF